MINEIILVINTIALILVIFGLYKAKFSWFINNEKQFQIKKDYIINKINSEIKNAFSISNIGNHNGKNVVELSGENKILTQPFFENNEFCGIHIRYGMIMIKDHLIHIANLVGTILDTEIDKEKKDEAYNELRNFGMDTKSSLFINLAEYFPGPLYNILDHEIVKHLSSLWFEKKSEKLLSDLFYFYQKIKSQNRNKFIKFMYKKMIKDDISIFDLVKKLYNSYNQIESN